MIQLHPTFLTKDGKPEFAVLPYEEFLHVQALLADLEDLQDLSAAKAAEHDALTVSLAQAKAILKL
jgi:hypothetical protein